MYVIADICINLLHRYAENKNIINEFWTVLWITFVQMNVGVVVFIINIVCNYLSWMCRVMTPLDNFGTYVSSWLVCYNNMYKDIIAIIVFYTLIVVLILVC